MRNTCQAGGFDAMKSQVGKANSTQAIACQRAEAAHVQLLRAHATVVALSMQHQQRRPGRKQLQLRIGECAQCG